jgi:hypothetical protein
VRVEGRRIERQVGLILLVREKRPFPRRDLPRELVDCFRPFLEYLAIADLSPKMIQKHVDNMWALGGEFIRDLNDNPALRKLPVEQHLFEMIEDGGPLLYHGGEDQQRSFDSTCRKFRRFLTATAR